MNFQLPPWFALFLASDDGEVKIVDLEQMCFPEERQEWENCVNFGNVDALFIPSIAEEAATALLWVVLPS